jgi:hydrogenase/urease accessory protein HupE
VTRRLRLPLLIALLSLCAAEVSAHPFLQNSWWVVVETNRLVMRVSATLREIAVVQQLDTNRVPALDVITGALEKHGDYLLKALQVEGDGQPLPGEVLDSQLVTDGGEADNRESAPYLDQAHAAFDLEFRLAGMAPREITFGHATLKGQSYAPGIPWDVTYALLVKGADRKELAAGLVRTDLPFSLELPGATNAVAPAITDAPARSAPLDGFGPTPRSVPFGDYVRLGVHHILTGWDHLLFLAALALAAAKLVDFFKLIGVFTLAHSITVTLSALNWVRLPPWFVEPVIAGSIVFAAVQNAVAPRAAQGRARLAVASGFGLVHGLGFAGGLNEAIGGVGGPALATAILAFCVGVELGHLVVGLPFWSVARAGRAELGEKFGERSLRWGSVLVGLGGAYFLAAALRNYL